MKIRKCLKKYYDKKFIQNFRNGRKQWQEPSLKTREKSGSKDIAPSKDLCMSGQLSGNGQTPFSPIWYMAVI